MSIEIQSKTRIKARPNLVRFFKKKSARFLVFLVIEQNRN